MFTVFASVFVTLFILYVFSPTIRSEFHNPLGLITKIFGNIKKTVEEEQKINDK
jgi:hypothetical protein